MTRLFTDGAETGDLLAFYSAVVSGVTGGGGVSTNVKRTGNYSYYANSNSGSYTGYLTLTKIIPDLTEVYVRGCLYTSAGFSEKAYATFSVSKDSGGNLISVSCPSGTAMNITVGSSIVATTPINLVSSQWYMLEVYFKLDDSVGSVQVKLDGKLILSYSGDTKPDATANFNRMKFMIQNAWNTTYLDDIAINDANGAVDNSWCGDGHIIALSPNAPGDINELTPTSGSAINNYQMVDETPPDDDTTYVEEDTAENYDLYNFSACGIDPNTQEISRLWVAITAKDTTTGSGIISPLIKTSGSVVESDGIELRTTYSHCKSAEYVINPMTGLPWTTDEVDSLQAGVRIKN